MSQKRNRKQEKEIYICGLILLGILLFWLAAERLLGRNFLFRPVCFTALPVCTVRAAAVQEPAVFSFPAISFSLSCITREFSLPLSFMYGSWFLIP